MNDPQYPLAKSFHFPITLGVCTLCIVKTQYFKYRFVEYWVAKWQQLVYNIAEILMEKSLIKFPV